MKVGRIIESYTAFAEGGSRESLIFASNRNLSDARLKRFSKWVFRFRVQSISIPTYLYCLVFSILEPRSITSSVSLCFAILCEVPTSPFYPFSVFSYPFNYPFYKNSE